MRKFRLTIRPGTHLFFFQAEDGIRDGHVTGVQTCALPILTDGHKYLLHANDVYPQASSIKICVLAELYRQAQQGKLKLTDLYTVKTADLVQDKIGRASCRERVEISAAAGTGRRRGQQNYEA